MNRVMVEASLVTPFAEFVAETVRCERATEGGREECQIADRTCVNDPLKLRNNRNLQMNGLSIPVLVLGENEPAAPNMLFPE
jgi:hypothetical protein